MRLSLEVVLRNEDGNDKVRTSRGDELLKKKSIFLAQEWEPGVWG